jgi:hypothetical protein
MSKQKNIELNFDVFGTREQRNTFNQTPTSIADSLDFNVTAAETTSQQSQTIEGAKEIAQGIRQINDSFTFTEALEQPGKKFNEGMYKIGQGDFTGVVDALEGIMSLPGILDAGLREVPVVGQDISNALNAPVELYYEAKNLIDSGLKKLGATDEDLRLGLSEETADVVTRVGDIANIIGLAALGAKGGQAIKTKIGAPKTAAEFITEELRGKNAKTVRSNEGQIQEARNAGQESQAKSGENLQQQTPEQTGVQQKALIADPQSRLVVNQVEKNVNSSIERGDIVNESQIYNRLSEVRDPVEVQRMEALYLKALDHNKQLRNKGKVQPSEPSPVVSPSESKPRFYGYRNKPFKGEGESKTRGLSQSTEARAIEKGLVDKFEGLPEYDVVKNRDQITMASELIAKDYQQAKNIAMGTERAPNNIIPEFIYKGVEAEAIKKGDVNTLRELATSSKLADEATVMGQRIQALRNQDPLSPVNAMKEIKKTRENRIAQGKDINQVKAQNVEQIKSRINKTVPKKGEWQTFIDSIRC